MAPPDVASLDRDALYAEFAPLVRRLIRQYGSSPSLREELPGEIYHRFCELLAAFDPQRGIPLHPYLVSRLTSSVYTYARGQWGVQKRETCLHDVAETNRILHLPDPTPTWIAAVAHKEVAAELPQALALLTERQRQVVIWRYYENCSSEDIAQRLEIRPATARSLLRLGLKNLRKHIQPTSCPDDPPAEP